MKYLTCFKTHNTHRNMEKPTPATTLSVDSATDLSSLTIGNQHFMTGV